MKTVPRTIIAVTSEDDNHAVVVDRAAGIASQTNATVHGPVPVERIRVEAVAPS